MNRRLMRALCISCFLLGCVIFTSESQAITNANWWRGLQLNYNTPGARAMGMGGAFISLADDATAAVSNPAGLTILTKPEFSIEFKTISQEINIKNYATEGDSKDFDNSVFSPAFLSYVVPKENYTFCIYRHEVLNFKNDHETKDVTLTNFAGWLRPEKTESKMNVTNYGVGFGVKVHKTLSVGGSIAFSQYNIDARDDRTSAGVYDFSNANIVNQIVENSSDTAYSGTIGILYKPFSTLQIGAVYFKAPEFNTDTKQYVSFLAAGPPFYLNKVVDTTFKLPDYYGVGISYKFFKDALTLSYDAKRVMYSNMTDKVSIAIGSTSNLKEGDYTIDDGWEHHVGIEYAIPLKTSVLALRAGYFYEPDHLVRYTGGRTASADQEAETLRYPAGDSDSHYTFGVGFSAGSLSLDFAGNMSNQVQEYTVSCVLRF